MLRDENPKDPGQKIQRKKSINWQYYLVLLVSTFVIKSGIWFVIVNYTNELNKKWNS